MLSPHMKRLRAEARAAKRQKAAEEKAKLKAEARRPICPYCNVPATFHPTSENFYRGRDFGPVWACDTCGAYVGCHKNGTGDRPLGTLANAEVREIRKQAHALFDELWRRKMQRDGWNQGKARGAGYRWLAAQLGIDSKECHIGHMQADLAQRVIAICRPYVHGSRASGPRRNEDRQSP